MTGWGWGETNSHRQHLMVSACRMLLSDLEVSPMKRTILAGIGTLALTAGVFAQAPAAGQFDNALAAAPGNMKDGAMVIKWKADGSYDTLRPGTNRLVCY